jgi:hypothetical protein
MCISLGQEWQLPRSKVDGKILLLGNGFGRAQLIAHFPGRPSEVLCGSAAVFLFSLSSLQVTLQQFLAPLGFWDDILSTDLASA